MDPDSRTWPGRSCRHPEACGIPSLCLSDRQCERNASKALFVCRGIADAGWSSRKDHTTPERECLALTCFTSSFFLCEKESGITPERSVIVGNKLWPGIAEKDPYRRPRCSSSRHHQGHRTIGYLQGWQGPKPIPHSFGNFSPGNVNLLLRMGAYG